MKNNQQLREKKYFFYNLIHVISKYSLKDVPVQSKCRILWSSISLEGNSHYCKLFCKVGSYQGKIASKTPAVGMVWTDVSSHPQSCSDFFGKFGWFGDGMTILKII